MLEPDTPLKLMGSKLGDGRCFYTDGGFYRRGSADGAHPEKGVWRCAGMAPEEAIEVGRIGEAKKAENLDDHPIGIQKSAFCPDDQPVVDQDQRGAPCYGPAGGCGLAKPLVPDGL